MLTFRKAILACLLLVAIGAPAAAQSPTELISNYRASKGLGRVTGDSTLDGIAQTQASAMAARDRLDHDVIGAFASRMGSSGSGRAAENIAYGHDSFPKTLNQWINSSGHRKNLLMPTGSRVGVASAKSSKTGRTYWAMVIAGDYAPPRHVAGRRAPKVEAAMRAAPAEVVARPAPRAKGKERAKACRVSFLGLCF